MRRIGFALLLVMCGCAAATNTGSTPPSVTASTGTASASPAVTVSPAPSQTVRPSTTPTYTGPRTLAESDSGATLKLQVGDMIRIALPSEYDPPTAQNDVMTRVSSTGGYPSGQPVDASFIASKPGRSDITTSTDYACLHAQPMCMIPQRLWIVHVIVS